MICPACDGTGTVRAHLHNGSAAPGRWADITCTACGGVIAAAILLGDVLPREIERVCGLVQLHDNGPGFNPTIARMQEALADAGRALAAGDVAGAAMAHARLQRFAA